MTAPQVTQERPTPEVGKLYGVTFNVIDTNGYWWRILCRRQDECDGVSWTPLRPIMPFRLLPGDTVLCLQVNYILAYDGSIIPTDAHPCNDSLPDTVDIYLHEQGVIALPRHCILPGPDNVK